ncbi:CD63 antigen-like [Strongylocentrotus purpuratus]|uniref:Tetraspanin n=1 Tax=Strongylocentrotus purpuratus TaxID=7668 RepID=A0A7M7PM93_STRPU|nr:CD63 antigen isoform X2 [Strongylocentrotus purpuratus]XP_030852820.1 CD63 antigen-like [Strongylocentrotus purpuratus]|eukprot:XP_800780.2 PREDICTED: CD63 antigen [Strongylocentrotus purpuratus]
MVEGTASCIKYLMFIFNFIFFIFGLGIIVGGSLTLTLYSEYVDFTGNTGTAIPIALICIGVFIFLTGFFGCCGAVKENYCMLGTYAFIMVLLLILELAAGISGYVLRDDIDKLVDDNMTDLQKEYNSSTSTQQLFDNMQKNLECCGVDNYTDWMGYNMSHPDMVPESCCMKPGTAGCNQVGSATLDIYTKPCYNALKDLLLRNIGIIAGVAIGIAVIEIFGIAFGCCLMRKIKNEYETV